MRRRRRLAVVGLAAAATASAVAAGLLTTPTAHADVAGPYFATQENGSDPHVIPCKVPNTVTKGYCLYTSRDMGAGDRYPGNWYPMEATYAFYSPDGYTGWIPLGPGGLHDASPVFHEDTLEAAGWVPTDAYHQWAPSAVEVVSGGTTTYYLYVPNVSDNSPGPPNDPPPNISTSSRISVSKSTTGPGGPFTYLGTVPHGYGYMSDPDVVMGGSSPILIWADGDFSTCGGFQSVVLQNDMITPGEHSRQFIAIDGIEALGTCTRLSDGVNVGRPYMEGASLYGSGTNWSIVFAVKPSIVPKECGAAVTAPGSANTTNEVVAWATSTTGPQGNYTYQGVLICGSTTEWTNQATLLNDRFGRSLIVYHDSPADIKERKLHAACRFTNADGSVVGGVFRQPSQPNRHAGFDDCWANGGKYYYGWHMTQPQYPDLPTIIQAHINGTALDANRYAVGPWERYKKKYVGSDGPYQQHVIQAFSNGNVLCTGPDMNTPITASCPEEDSEDNPYALWRYISYPGGRYLLYSPEHGRFVGLGADGLLYANVGSPHGAARLTELYPGGLPAPN